MNDDLQKLRTVLQARPRPRARWITGAMSKALVSHRCMRRSEKREIAFDKRRQRPITGLRLRRFNLLRPQLRCQFHFQLAGLIL